MSQLSPRGRRVLTLLLPLFGLSLGCLLAEASLRLLKPPQAAITRAPCIYEMDDILGFRFQPGATGWMQKNFEINNFVQINSLGFHDIEHPWAAPNRRRILVVGDSFTAGLEVDRSLLWTQVLQRELASLGYTKLDVINLGIDGTGTDIHLRLIERYLAQFQPELVILAFYKNDPDDITKRLPHRECYRGYTLAFRDPANQTRLRTFMNEAKPLPPPADFLYRHSFSVRMATFYLEDDIFWRNGYQVPNRNYHAAAMLDLPVDHQAESPPGLDELVLQLKHQVEAAQARLLILPVPANDRWNQPADSRETLIDNLSEPVLAQVQIIDVLPAMKTLLSEDQRTYEMMFWRYDEHMNAYGHEILGVAAASAIDEVTRNAPIELQVRPSQAGLWTVVQWQDAQGNWNAVENWQGPLNGGGSIRWWVAEKDFGTGPFRWAIFEAPDGTLLQTSDPFFMPMARQTLRLEVGIGLND